MGLVEDSRAARAAGLSYGQYVARYGTSPTVQIEPEQEKGKWWYIKKKKRIWCANAVVAVSEGIHPGINTAPRNAVRMRNGIRSPKHIEKRDKAGNRMGRNKPYEKCGRRVL